MSFIASYGYTHARILEDPDYGGNEPVNVPHHTGSLSLTYDFGEIDSRGDSLKLGGGVRAVGRRPGINTNAYYLPGYMVADAFAAYTLKNERPLTLQLNLKNIFNKTYYTSSIGTTALGNQIGEPFSAVLSASVQF